MRDPNGGELLSALDRTRTYVGVYDPPMAVYCSVITRSFLAHARVLSQSIQQHHPKARVHVLVVDADDDSSHREEFEVLTPQDCGIGRKHLHQMAAIYEASELCVAVEPALLRFLLDVVAEPVVYLDSDMLVLAPLNDVDEIATQHGLVLTLHNLEPTPYGDLNPSEPGATHDDLRLLATGQFNAGFLAVTREAIPFLQWWDGWLKRHCLHKRLLSLWGDQKWLDCVPSFFEHAVLRDPGINVAPWNLHQRAISKRAGGYLCAGRPLRLFHFSGFDPRTPELLEPRYSPAKVPSVIEPLCTDYAQRLFDQNYAEVSSTSYGFAETAAGLRINGLMRTLYRDALLDDAEEDLPDPFDAEEAPKFVEWLRSPTKGTHYVSRYLAGLHASSPDVRANFPDLSRAVDRLWYLRAAHRVGTEWDIPPELLPRLEELTPVQGTRVDEPPSETEMLRERVLALEAEVLALQVELAQVRSSKVMRYTAPLRAVWAALHSRRSRPVD